MEFLYSDNVSGGRFQISSHLWTFPGPGIPETQDGQKTTCRRARIPPTVVSREISDFLASAKASVSLSVNVTNRCAGPVDDAKYPRDYPSVHLY